MSASAALPTRTRALILLAILSTCYPCAHAAEPQSPSSSNGTTVTGVVSMLRSSVPSGQDTLDVYLHQDDGRMYRLSFCNDVVSETDLASNARVTVTYNRIEDGVMYCCQKPTLVDNGKAVGGAGGPSAVRRELFGATITTPTRPSFLIYVVRMCGYSLGPVTTASKVYDFFFGNNSSLSGYYDTCSYNQVAVQPSQVKVVEGLEIPCSGTVTLPFSFPSGNSF
ncbi:hypothetical protein VaNZ11_003045, partial [Volvox africanus]